MEVLKCEVLTSLGKHFEINMIHVRIATELKLRVLLWYAIFNLWLISETIDFNHAIP